MKTRSLMGGVLLLAVAAPAHATILTFDIGGISNGQNVDQAYGDNVTATTMGSFGYGVGTEGFTPNVVATYGNNDPSLWTTGYGNLQNILYENQDNTGILTVTLTADSGLNVVLHEFSLAAYNPVFSGDPTVQSISVTDGGSNTYFSVSNATVSATSSTHFDFTANPIMGQTLQIVVDARNLGGLNDDIGIDNIRFGQAVPEPASLAVLAVGGIALIRRRRKA